MWRLFGTAARRRRGATPRLPLGNRHLDCAQKAHSSVTPITVRERSRAVCALCASTPESSGEHSPVRTPVRAASWTKVLPGASASEESNPPLPAANADLGLMLSVPYSSTTIFRFAHISFSTFGHTVTLTSPRWALCSSNINVRDWPIPPPIESGIRLFRIAW